MASEAVRKEHLEIIRNVVKAGQQMLFAVSIGVLLLTFAGSQIFREATGPRDSLIALSQDRAEALSLARNLSYKAIDTHRVFVNVVFGPLHFRDIQSSIKGFGSVTHDGKPTDADAAETKHFLELSQLLLKLSSCDPPVPTANTDQGKKPFLDWTLDQQKSGPIDSLVANRFIDLAWSEARTENLQLRVEGLLSGSTYLKSELLPDFVALKVTLKRIEDDAANLRRVDKSLPELQDDPIGWADSALLKESAKQESSIERKVAIPMSPMDIDLQHLMIVSTVLTLLIFLLFAQHYIRIDESLKQIDPVEDRAVVGVLLSDHPLAGRNNWPERLAFFVPMLFGLAGDFAVSWFNEELPGREFRTYLRRHWTEHANALITLIFVWTLLSLLMWQFSKQRKLWAKEPNEEVPSEAQDRITKLANRISNESKV